MLTLVINVSLKANSVTQNRMPVQEQSVLGLHCFPKEASKSFQRMIKQTKCVVIGALRVNFTFIIK